MQTIYEAAGGEEVLRLASAWHVRVMADEVVGHAFSHGFRDDHTPTTTTMMMTMDRYLDSAADVPAGLSIPKWSWDGLVE